MTSNIKVLVVLQNCSSNTVGFGFRVQRHSLSAVSCDMSESYLQKSLEQVTFT